MRLAKMLLWLILALLMGGCESMAGAMSDKSVMAPPGPPPAEADEEGSGFVGGDGAPTRQLLAAGEQAPAPLDPTTTRPGQPPAKPDATAPVQTTGPLLVYTANYTLAVYEVKESIDKVQALAKDLGGYLVRRDDASITVRVPADKYRSALDGVNKVGDVVHHEETVEDVTEQFYDMKTRLDNARAMRNRLEELLAASKDVSEALEVEKELGRITETIEQMEGKLKRLSELINFSTITVTFAAQGAESVDSNVRLPFPWLDRLGLGPLLQLN